MYFDDDELNEEKQKNLFAQAGKSAFNTLFLTVFRHFNSREVSVEKNPVSKQRAYYKYEQLGPSGMSLLTENFLRGNLIKNLASSSPESILKEVNDFFKISKDPVYLLIAADICRFFARRTVEDEQIKFHLSAFRYCILAFYIQKERESSENKMLSNLYLLQELQIYNETTAGIFSCLKRKNLLENDTIAFHGIDGSEFIIEKPISLLSVPRSAISDFSLCSDYAVKALRMINRHSGAGVPLVARISEQTLSQALRTPPGLTIPVTFFFRVNQLSENQMSLLPYYQDTSISETFDIREDCPGHGIWTLSRDFSTPLACFMDAITQRNLLSGMLYSNKYDEQSGLYMVEPYHPGKIPVVFVHGLMSSPETWGQMLNSLKYDPKIRQKYQFWFFSYSTGAPVLYSAAKLRKALLDAQKEFCTTPEATRNFEQMVLIGHSMGGLVSRLLLQKNPYQIIEYFAQKTWGEIKKMLSPEDWNLVENFVIFPPLPFVRRVIFMAVPHRGAAMAQKGLAKLGINLIRLPRNILNKTNDLSRIMKKVSPGTKFTWKKTSFITGIDNLKPDGFFVQWFGDSLLKEDVLYHSIIGNKEAAGMPGGSDGIVSYQSSHLNRIVSECIVKSDHSVHRRPAAIREVMRILLLHLN